GLYIPADGRGMEQNAHFQRIARSDVEQRLQEDLLDAHRRGRLQPDSLPDAGRAEVVAADGPAADRLTAARLVAVLRILRADDQSVRAGPQVGRDLEAERHVAALIAADLAAVYPDGRLVVDGAEVEQNISPSPLGGCLEVARIPGAEVDLLLVDTR